MNSPIVDMSEYPDYQLAWLLVGLVRLLNRPTMQQYRRIIATTWMSAYHEACQRPSLSAVAEQQQANFETMKEVLQ